VEERLRQQEAAHAAATRSHAEALEMQRGSVAEARQRMGAALSAEQQATREAATQRARCEEV
jgi:hypothetical protein